MRAIVRAKGKVTIPKPLRVRLGLRPGTGLDFVEEQGALVARRITKSDAFGGLVALPTPTDADAALTASRGPGWLSHLDGNTHPRLGDDR